MQPLKEISKTKDFLKKNISFNRANGGKKDLG